MSVTIATTPGIINKYPVSQENVGKASLKEVGIDVGDILPMVNKVADQVSRIPELVAPSVVLNTELSEALRGYLQEIAKDPEFIRVSELVQDRIKEQVEQGKPLDITGLSSQAVALLVAANSLLLLLDKAQTAMSSKLSLVSFDAARSIAASMEREGLDSLSGSISQSALQLGITAVGAKMESKGLKNERSALKQQGGELAKLNDKLGTELKNGALGSQSRIHDINAEIALKQSIFDDKKLLARGQQTSGDAVMKSSQAIGTVAGGAGQYAATVERAEQQISQANSRVATSASDEARESSRKILALISELMNYMNTIIQSQNNTAGNVASNIRA